MTNHKQILVVDDEKQLISLVKLHLDMAGYDVLTASDGEKALSVAAKERPDLIILDLMLPKMDGWEVCRILKSDKDTANIPVIMLTARTDTESVLKGFECGADDYVTKPFSPRELIARVKRTLVHAGYLGGKSDENQDNSGIMNTIKDAGYLMEGETYV
jgi:DNA-binding response OmpR family regulator